MRIAIRSAALLILVVPGMVWGLGLGNIEVDTALNQPLDAEIRMLSINPADVADVRVSLASQEAFDRAGLDRSFALSGLEFTPIVKPDGEIVISVTSNNPIREPFLNFIIDVQWPAGRMLREYTILLDPPTLMEQRPVIATEEPVIESAEPERPRIVERPAPVAAPVRASGTSVSGRTHATVSGDTLSEIASDTFGVDGDNLPQAMLALLRANPDAFFDNNINNLKAGAILRMPDEGEINALTRAEAIAEVDRQNGLWREYQTQLAENIQPQPLPEPANDTAPTDIASGADAKGAASQVAPQAEGQTLAEGEDPAAAAEDAGLLTGDAVLAEDRLEIMAADGGDVQAEAVLVAGGENAAALREQTALAQELAESRGQENKELQTRMRELESMLAKQQRIIDLQSDQLAELQQRFGTEPLAHDGQITVPAAMRNPSTEAAQPATARTAEPETAGRRIAKQPVAGDGVITIPATERLLVEQGGGEATPGQGVEAVETAAQTETEAMAAGESPAAEGAAGDESVNSESVSATSANPGEPAAASAETEAVTEPAATATPDGKRPVTGAETAPAESDFISGLLGNPRMLIGLGGALLLVIALIAFFKQRRTSKQAGEEEIYTAQGYKPAVAPALHAAAATGSARAFAGKDTAAGGSVNTEWSAQDAAGQDDDVISEADVYIAYGLHPQATDLLKDALQQNPERNDYRVKLLEACQRAGDKQAFDAEVYELHAALDGQPAALWQQAAEMGRSFSPDHPLFSDEGTAGALNGYAAAADAAAVEDREFQAAASYFEPAPNEDLSAPDQTGGVDAESPFGLDEAEDDEAHAGAPAAEDAKTLELSFEEMEFIREQEAAAHSQSMANTSDSHAALEFDVSDLDFGAPIGAEEGQKPADDEVDAAENTRESFDIDFLPGESGIRVGPDPFTMESDEKPAEEPGEDEFAIDLDDPTLLNGAEKPAASDIDLNLNAEDTLLLESDVSDSDTLMLHEGLSDSDTLLLDEDLSPEQYLDDDTLADAGDEVGTKLDLAKAFLDMGDTDGALGALEEVLHEGDNDQRKEAEGLMAQIA